MPPGARTSRSIKPTRDEHERRIDMAVSLIMLGAYDGQIKRAISAKCGCSQRSVERYLRRAREVLAQRRNRGRNELQAESMAFYESVIADKSATRREKLMARRRLDQLLGLEEPKRHELSGPDGGPIQSEVSARDQAAAIMRDPEAMKMAIALGKRLRECGDDGDDDDQ